MPALDQSVYGVLTVLFFELATRYLCKKVSKKDKTVRFIIDELAYLPNISNSVIAPALVRSYKISFIFSCQTLEQIKDKCGKEKLAILITNCAYTIILGQHSEETARMLSNMIGKTL